MKSNWYEKRSPEVKKLLDDALGGKLTKSEFLDKYLVLPRKRKHRIYKNHKVSYNIRNINCAYREAILLEKRHGWLWRDPLL